MKNSWWRRFAWLLEKIPGYLAFVGCRNEEEEYIYPLHHEKFGIDENGMNKWRCIICSICFRNTK